MKNIMYLCNLMFFTLVGCQNSVTEMVTYKINEPVFLSYESFRNSVKVTAEPHKITSIGKMCFYNDYLYISEPQKGIHIIDNRNPANPQIVGFVELLGNADLAIRNGLLYADSYIDLVWFDISNASQPVLKGRLDSIFPTALPPMPDNGFGIDYNQCYTGNKGVVVGYRLTERTEDVNHYTGGGWYGKGIMLYDALAGSAASGGNAATGINGSMSKFAIYNDRLYSVVNNYMSIFDLTGDKPSKTGVGTYLGWNIETIFSYKDNMFMGTPTGMLIYSLKDPLKPVYASSVQHVFGCDPVVVDNDLAYVTLHSEASRCGQTVNELMVVDVSNVYKPVQLVTYSMTSPKGLGIDNGKLFLCDDGLKIYRISNPQTLMANKIVQFKDMNGFDVIAHNNVVMMIADDGIYQYDYSNEIR
jgi:Uncharacterized conserved protein